MNFTHRFARALFFLISILSSYSQDVRKIEFKVYGQYPLRDVVYAPQEPSGEENLNDAVKLPIKSHSLERTGPYRFEGGDHIEFYDSDSGTLVGRVLLPDASNDFLFIFVRNPRHSEDPNQYLKYLIYPFDDSASNLPSNSLVFVNISGRKLDGLLAQNRVQLGPGESEIFKVEESLPINLWAEDFRGEKLLPALKKTYTFVPEHRYLIIFFPPVLRGSSTLDVRFLSDFTNM